MVQLLAPIGAFRVVAHAVSDPLYLATICSGMASSQIFTSDPSSAARRHCCGLCGVSHGGAVAVDPLPLIFVVLQRQYRLIAAEATDHMPPVRAGSHAQARAPPAFLTSSSHQDWCGPWPCRSVQSSKPAKSWRRITVSYSPPPGWCAARCWHRLPFAFPSTPSPVERQTFTRDGHGAERSAAGVRPPRNATRSGQPRQYAPGRENRRDQGAARRAGGAEPSGADRVNNTGWRCAGAGRGLQEFNRRQHHQGHPGLRAGRFAPKWATTQAFDPRSSCRNFHLRGVQLYMDGIPINTADGYGDFQEIDPTAYKYVESEGRQRAAVRREPLGGAINFVIRPVAIHGQRDVGRWAHSGSSGCRRTPAAQRSTWTVSSPRPPKASGWLQGPQFRQQHRVSAMSAINSRRMPKRGSISTPMRSPAHPRQRHQQSA